MSTDAFVVEIIRKSILPLPSEVTPQLREAAAAAASIKLREPRPPGFPLLFSANFDLIEPALAYLHEHAIRHAHTPDTLNTYMEVLYDWFDALEQSGIAWGTADAVDLVAYRNRMLRETSGHTGRPYCVRTINHRVRGVLRFYEWMVRSGWLSGSDLVGRGNDLAISHRSRSWARRDDTGTDRSLFVLRQFETLPRPLTSPQLRELLARLPSPYDLMARWQLYTGLRVGELLTLTVKDVLKHAVARRCSNAPQYHVVEVMRKGRKSGYVIAAESLLQETTGYLSEHRRAWINRAARKRQAVDSGELFINSGGRPVKKNSYQQVIAETGAACGFRATTHLMRSTFACMMLARLERLASQGAAINPLLIVKILMGHEQIATTDRYLRAIAVDTVVLTDVLNSLFDPE
jgi:integrase/recombinase XerD